MTTRSRADDPALRQLAPDGVITAGRLRMAGLAASTIASRCRPGGPWRRLLPQVVLLGGGEPTRHQLLSAAVLQFGPDSVITGLDALRAYGMVLPVPARVDLLVPYRCRTAAQDFVIPQRTGRLPDPVRVDGLPFAPPTRAVLDAARREGVPDRLRQLLTTPIYYGLCTAEELRAELEAGNQRGSAAVRDVLRCLCTMRDTFVHGLARTVALRTPLPPPRWNVTVCDARGRPIGVADGWWDEVALGWQFGAHLAGSAVNLSYLALKAAGVVLVRTPAAQLRDAPEQVVNELGRAFGTAARRRRPPVRGVGLQEAA
jgi:hypothetical protein